MSGHTVDYYNDIDMDVENLSENNKTVYENIKSIIENIYGNDGYY